MYVWRIVSRFRVDPEQEAFRCASEVFPENCEAAQEAAAKA